MDIKPLENKLKNSKIKHPYSEIIKFPNKVLLCGSTGTGKSVVLHNILEKMYKNFYDKLYFFSVNSNYEEDNLTLAERNPKTSVELIDTDYIEKITKIWNDIYEDQNIRKNKKRKLKKYCFVFDDLITNKKFMKSKAVADLYIMGRKYNCQIFSLTQKYKAVPLLHRLNTQNLIIFNDQGPNEVKKLAEEMSSGAYGYKFIQNIFSNTLSKIPYSFLHIDRTKPINKRFMLNFQSHFSKE